MRTESQGVIDDVVSKLWIAPISTTHLELSIKIAERCLGEKNPDLIHKFYDPRKFTVGEYCPRYALGNGGPKNLKGKHVYAFLIPGPHKGAEELVEKACLAARAAKESGADKFTLLMTDMPHGRQDRGPDEDARAIGEPNTIRWHARKFRAAGIDEIITTHEHSPRISAFFAIEYGLVPEGLRKDGYPQNPWDVKVPKHVDPNDEKLQEAGRKVFKSISPHAVFADYLLYESSLVGSEYLRDGGARLILKRMDQGNGIFIDNLERALFLPNIARINCLKARKSKNNPDAVEVQIDNVSDNLETMDGKCELFADDGMDTAGTMIKAVKWSEQGNVCAKSGKKYGVPEERLVYFTHAWLGGKGHQVIQERVYKNLPACEFVMTNSRPYVSDSQYYRLKTKSTVLRFAGLWADAILANEQGYDLSQRYSGFGSKEEQHRFISTLYAMKRHSRHFLVEEPVKERRQIKFLLRE